MSKGKTTASDINLESGKPKQDSVVQGIIIPETQEEVSTVEDFPTLTSEIEMVTEKSSGEKESALTKEKNLEESMFQLKTLVYRISQLAKLLSHRQTKFPSLQKQLFLKLKSHRRMKKITKINHPEETKCH